MVSSDHNDQSTAIPEADQFEQEQPGGLVGRVGLHLLDLGVDGCLELPGLEEFARGDRRSGVGG